MIRPWEAFCRLRIAECGVRIEEETASREQLAPRSWRRMAPRAEPIAAIATSGAPNSGFHWRRGLRSERSARGCQFVVSPLFSWRDVIIGAARGASLPFWHFPTTASDILVFSTNSASRPPYGGFRVPHSGFHWRRGLRSERSARGSQLSGSRGKCG